MMDQIVEVHTGLLLQTLLHLFAAALAATCRWKEEIFHFITEQRHPLKPTEVLFPFSFEPKLNRIGPRGVEPQLREPRG